MLTVDRLLTSPFEYSQAFDRALKEVIKTLPNRPARETADDVVSARYVGFHHHYNDLISG